MVIETLAMVKGSFKSENALEWRQQEAHRIKEKYPDRLPVIVEKAAKCYMPDVEKKKYLVRGDFTVGQFVYVVRKRIKLSTDKAIFIFTANNVLPPQSALMSSIYEENVDVDGFLYLTYSGESAFGSLLEEDPCE